jgi:hypothetical protein
MSILTAAQATELGDQFSRMGDNIRDFYLGNFDTLSHEERDTFSKQMMEMWSMSSSMYTLSAVLVLDDLDASLQQIRGIEAEIGTTLKNLANVQKAIDITGAAVGLAAALLSKDPKVIGTSIEGLAGKIAEARTV